MALTEKQLAAFNFIVNFNASKHRSPTLEQIAGELGLNHRTQAHRLVQSLCEKKYLSKEHNTRGGITIIKYPLGGVSPTTGEPKAGDVGDAQCRAAYARGVAAGRATTFPDLQASHARAVEKAYERGLEAGQAASWPANHIEAFERGIKFGKDELKAELRLQRS